jgi:hypothetical protein
MIFKDYLNGAWNEHATNAEKVFKEFKSNFHLCETSADTLALGNLIVHVSGEHLAKWSEGLALLRELKETKPVEDEKAFDRFFAILSLCADKNTSLESFSDSDRTRVLAVSSSALASQNELERAGEYLKQAQLIGQNITDNSDPAIRSLAITGWNLACALEEKEELKKDEIELMKLAAHTTRIYWEKAGDWKDTEQSEYRLASSYLKANEIKSALKHAELCFRIVEENKADSYEHFYAYEILARCWSSLGEQNNCEAFIHLAEKAFAELSSEQQNQTKASLEKLKAL